MRSPYYYSKAQLQREARSLAKQAKAVLVDWQVGLQPLDGAEQRGAVEPFLSVELRQKDGTITHMYCAL